MKSQRVLVVGGSSGMGFAVAEACSPPEPASPSQAGLPNGSKPRLPGWTESGPSRPT
ncbi:hypothetical protein [Amycolatopsis sp.]|uniref:hypothetical protein n=1 Tax=Amycolatopsis sp. TaxID=37632 RepID=UPI00260FFCAB|nr:hypothetical protein [Amycolatopsis sp.]